MWDDYQHVCQERGEVTWDDDLSDDEYDAIEGDLADAMIVQNRQNCATNQIGIMYCSMHTGNKGTMTRKQKTFTNRSDSMSFSPNPATSLQQAIDTHLLRRGHV